MIDITKKYRTRDDHEVRIYATDCGGKFPVHGAINYDGIWLPDKWTIKGAMFSDDERRPEDLIEVKPRIKREVWVNLYNDEQRWSFMYNSKDSADDNSDYSRIACVRLTIDCEEGEGL